MSDIKDVIALLCKHLNLSIGVSIKPEYFATAKFNKDNKEAAEAFWTILHILGRHAVNDMGIDDVDRYDDVYATKLYFAFMEYPATDFYALPTENTATSNCRELLLALGWLLATKNVLNIAVKTRLVASTFGHEFPQDFSPEKLEMNPECLSSDMKIEASKIIEKCGRISHNVKEISELIEEKIRSMTKIHAASMNTSGLPHLSVHEVALAKKSFGKASPDYSESDEKSLKDLASMATMLETHARWMRKSHVFYDWMVTVIEEKKKMSDSVIASSRRAELSSFVTLLRHVTKKKLHLIKNNEPQSREIKNFQDFCTSRYLRTGQETPETDKWIENASNRLSNMELDVASKMTKLTAELQKMLKSINNCVQV